MLSDKILNRRCELGLTQRDISLAIDVSELSVRCWEKGIYEPSVTHLVKLSILLDISLDELLEEEFKHARSNNQ